MTDVFGAPQLSLRGFFESAADAAVVGRAMARDCAHFDHFLQKRFGWSARAAPEAGSEWGATVVPLAAGVCTRRALLHRGAAHRSGLD